MAKFMVLYNAPVAAGEFMSQSSPEDMKAGMEAWVTWKDTAEAQGLKVDFGMPLQTVARITPDGSAASDSQASGYSMVEAESKDKLEEMLRSHPHLRRAGASIDVLELLSMPGLDA